ncbi:hypothetical protein SCLCIDRAFT_68957, partial [Scleroderma citrinum Foug A]
SVDQTKASFMGITAHWIESPVKIPTSWSLVSEVITFCAISGPHTGANLGRYFVNLNNNTACNEIENILNRKHIYSFDSNTQRLPCLAHVMNLAITDVMSVITHIASMETTSAIWEFDPSLPRNRILNDSLDVISAVWMLAIKIQASGQCIAYFECLQAECGIAVPLSISLHSNV